MAVDSTLFNPGFIGGNFIWWIGQIADDSSWRINHTESKFKTASEENQPADKPGKPPAGWGYRYKVRIIGAHDQDEEIVASDQLPWAQVMYSVWGGGQGATFMTPGLKQGMFVFGFYLDGQDQQVPVIMGVLGNNAKTTLERKTGTKEGKNFTPQSFYSKNENKEPDEQKKLKHANVSVDESTNKQNEAPDATHQRSSADEQKDAVLKEPHALACPDPDHKSEMKNIQTDIQKLSTKLDTMKRSMATLDSAVGLPVPQFQKNVDAEIKKSSEMISKHMKGILGKVQQFTTNEFNEKSMPMLNLAVPSFKNKLMEDHIAGLEKLACTFNGIAGAALAAGIAAALMNAFKNKKKKSEEKAALEALTTAGIEGVDPEDVIVPQPQLDTPGADVLPPTPKPGFYSPDPLCSTEELVGEILGQNINTIISTFDSAIGPIVSSTQESMGEKPTEAGSEGVGSLNTSVNESNTLAALGSGALVGAMTETIAEQAGVNPRNIGSVVNPFITGNYGMGMENLLELAGVTSLENQSAIANSLTAIASGDLLGGFGAVSGILGVDSSLMQGVGGAFGAIVAGDIPGLINQAGALSALHPGILESIIGKGSALAGPDFASLTGQLGSMGGLSFDVASSVGFIKTVTQVYDCDPEVACSPNDVHTMDSGGAGADQMSEEAVAKSATATATKTGTTKSFGTKIEKTDLINKGAKVLKKFKLPASTVTDLNSDIA